MSREIKTMLDSALNITPGCISAYVICRTPQGPRYLLLRRCSQYLRGTWQMVSGGIDAGETAAQTAFREIQEETGLTPHALYSADAVETFYMLSTDKIQFVPVFVAFVDSTDVVLSPHEHDAFEWLPYEDARERLVFSEQRRVIAHIHEQCVQKPPNELLRVQIVI